MTNHPLAATTGDTAGAAHCRRALPWATRASAMPHLPGGMERQVETLKDILLKIEDAQGDLRESVQVGSNLKPLGELATRLVSAGLLGKLEPGRVALTQEARFWLASQEPQDLLGTLHCHVRFVGEMLEVLRENPLTTRELHQIAASRYLLMWTSKDQVTRRLAWLTGLGMVSRKDATHWQLTDQGLAALDWLELGEPEVDTVAGGAALEMPQAPAAIEELLAKMDEATLASRNSALGYIPSAKDGSGVVGSLTMLVEACSPSITKAEFLRLVQREFGVADSSFGMILTTLTRSGLIQETALGVYSPTPAAAAWLETGEPLDLILIMHMRYLFMLEIIPLLEEHPDAPALARVAHERFGLTRVDVGGVRRRLQLLAAAGLIFQRSTRRFAATPLGRAVVEARPHSSADVVDETEEGAAQQDVHEQQTAALGQALIDAGLASDDPVRLERLTAQAFAVLGFETRHVGGAGQTDVLATLDGEGEGDIRIMVDAKSAGAGDVSEKSVSFDTLREHRKQHEAKFVVLVGPGFEIGRVRARAKENQVRLMTTRELASVLERHATTPMSAVHYVDLVSPDVDRAQLCEARWHRAERLKSLFAHVVAVLAQERAAGDQVTSGALTPDQIYLIVRDEVDPRPEPQDIEKILELLEHPLVGAVTRGTTGGRSAAYRLRDDPRLVAEKLEALTTSLATAFD